MEQRRTRHRERIALLCGLLCLGMAGLTGRLFFLMTCRADEYSSMATELHQRERTLKAARGRILDRNGTVIADNRTVCNKMKYALVTGGSLGGSQQRAFSSG